MGTLTLAFLCLVAGTPGSEPETWPSIADPALGMQAAGHRVALKGLAPLAPPDADLMRHVKPPVWQTRSRTTIGRIAGLLTGAATTALLHEGGHAILTWAHGRKFEWPTHTNTAGSISQGIEFFLPSWRAVGATPVERRNIAAGGFVLETAISEALLLSNVFPKDDAFVVGLLFYSVINSILYVSRDANSLAVGGRGYGDIREMACRDCDSSQGRIPRELAYTFIILRGAITFARLANDPAFLKLSFWSSPSDMD